MVLIVLVEKYGLRNIARKILGGALFFSVLHAAAFWYVRYQIGGAGDFAAMERKFANYSSIWNTAVTVLGFPLGFFEADGAAYIGLMILNSLIWGVILSFVIVPAVVKK